MQKQADFHVSGGKESEAVITNIPAPASTESKPRGVHDYAHPRHITRGAAESHTDPIEDPVEDKPLVSGAGNRK